MALTTAHSILVNFDPFDPGGRAASAKRVSKTHLGLKNTSWSQKRRLGLKSGITTDRYTCNTACTLPRALSYAEVHIPSRISAYAELHVHTQDEMYGAVPYFFICSLAAENN